MKTSGTCVIGRLTNLTAFASVELDGHVWMKSYPDMDTAIKEAKRNGLVDKLFAAAAAQYIAQQRRPCVAPIAVPIDPRKLAELGFTQPRSEIRS